MAMNGKTGIFLTACWITMALSCVDVRAQDTSRVPDTNPQPATDVDASVHADVQDGAKQQTQPPLQSNKRAPTYSKWGFPSANQPSATQFRPAQATTTGLAPSGHAKNLSSFGGPSVQAETPGPISAIWPGRATDSTIAPATDAKSTKPDRQSNLFGVSPASANGHRDRSTASTGRPLLETQSQPLSAQPDSFGFSTPFHGKELGEISASSFPDPFPKTYSSSQDQAKAKQRKSVPLKSGEKPHASATAGSSSGQKKKVGSQLATKPE
jgi:hypothetical protein